MRPRYLLAITQTGAPPAFAERLAAATGLDRVFDHPPMFALADPACHCLAGRGAVLGTLFHRHGPARAIEVLDQTARQRLFADNGDTLLRSFWGGYVAAFPASAGATVLRDPSGALPCYYAATASATLFASDVDLLLACLPAHPQIDRDALARHLWRGNLPAPETVLGGIFELLPGFAIEVAGHPGAQRPRWSPWDHVCASEAGREETAERLRRLVSQCVMGWTGSHGSLLVSVSGGLDSSIVAACLARGHRPAHCLTLYGDDPSGDERGYARDLCTHLALSLAERRYRVEDIDIAAPLAAHLPRPIGRTQEQAYERAHLSHAQAIGASAFVTGNGGDNVFGYSQSAGAIVDRFRQQGLSLGVLRTFVDVCRQTGCGPGAAVGATVRLLRRRSYRWRPVPGFLHPDVQAILAREDLTHPWLEPPVPALPGKLGHVAALLRVQHTLEPGRSRHAPVLHPLLSQPIVEACLGVPSWAWRADGIDRAVARQAFAADLPPAIVQRRAKGGPDGFCAAIVGHHRAAILERLLAGRLARHGLLDRVALEQSLHRGRQTTSTENVRILDLLDTEAWLDAWSSRGIALTARDVPIAGG